MTDKEDPTRWGDGCTIREKRSALFSLGGEPIWNVISIRGIVPFKITMLFLCIDEPLLLVLRKRIIVQIEIAFSLGSPPYETATYHHFGIFPKIEI